MDYHSSSKLLCFLIVVCFASSVTCDTYRCSENGNYTTNSTYQTNLNDVLSTINSNTDIDYGFYNFSSTGNSDRAHAIALCRGDVTVEVCKQCLSDATTNITERCPDQKEAIGWLGKCILRYSNRSNIFGTYESRPFIFLSTVQNVTDPAEFGAALGELMANLSIRASSGDDRRKFASGRVVLESSENLNGLVQCTPDLTRIDCLSCLTESINNIRRSIGYKRGGIYAMPSCFARFEMYEFFEHDTPAVTPAIAPPPLQVTPPPPVETPGQTNTTDSTVVGKNSKNTSLRVITIVAVCVATPVVLLIALFLLRIYLQSKKPRKRVEARGEVIATESLQYGFNTIKLATDDFSEANKLGEGGFGAVYKGRLLDGREIAVKRLSTRSGQGDQEFMTEVKLLAKLQHKNLVRLLGFSLEGDERLLIYEFVPNSSLDTFLFDKVKRTKLNWATRYKIIGGITKGLLYLHEDSRLRIIHRDLKASNILLDADMTPKIADFGLARLFVVDQTQGNTSKIAGTRGYMAPEYVMHGMFSVKSDVYSFGVLVLEIICGLKSTSFRSNESDDFLSYAWRNMKAGTIETFVDPTLTGGSNSEVKRCIHIGLLSVQENVADRPTMASIVMMLNSYSITLPRLSKPSTRFIPRVANSDSSATTRSDRSQNVNAAPGVSINDVTISELYPR